MPAKKTKIDIDREKLFDGLFSGRISINNLPKDLYEQTANVLMHGVFKGYKGSFLDFKFDTPDYQTLTELRENIYMFSGAKTFQQTIEMSDALINEDNQIVSFSEFKKAASDIFDRYNEDWLEAEYNTAVDSARSAAKWNDIEKNKHLFPNVRYSAVGDEHTCPICLSLDGLIAPVGASVWSSSAPPNHFNCECVLEQLDEADTAELGGVYSEQKINNALSLSQEHKDPLFNFNPGVDKVVFKDTGRDKHPYFDVSQRYRELADNNFNLPIP